MRIESTSKENATAPQTGHFQDNTLKNNAPDNKNEESLLLDLQVRPFSSHAVLVGHESDQETEPIPLRNVLLQRDLQYEVSNMTAGEENETFYRVDTTNERFWFEL